MGHTWKKKTRDWTEEGCSADPGVEGKLIHKIRLKTR